MRSKRGVGHSGGEAVAGCIGREGPQGLACSPHSSSPYTPAAQRWSCRTPTCRNLWQMSMC